MLDYLRALIATRIRSERGASAVEYGLLCAAVLAAGAFAWETLGDGVRTVFNNQNATISNSP